MRQVTKYTDAIKASVLSKVLAPNSPGVIELARASCKTIRKLITHQVR